MENLERSIKAKGAELGFELVGIAAASEAETYNWFRSWLGRGHAATMNYMAKYVEARRHPASILPSVKSVIMVGMNYRVDEQPAHAEGLPAKIARYALGSDYHAVLRTRLKKLLGWLKEKHAGCWGRAVVDTAPLLERDFARRAGLGWFGKNTMLLNKRLGSFFFLGALLVDIELQPDTPHESAHCGTCTACLEACPTQAFVAPFELDARRCLSYLNIELRGSVPAHLRTDFTEWLFGCDVCQEVCPWNRKAPLTREPAFEPRPELLTISLEELLTLDELAFHKRFNGTALLRSDRQGVLRSAALILGNRGDGTSMKILEAAAHDADPVVQEACRWAIERIQNRSIHSKGAINPEIRAVDCKPA